MTRKPINRRAAGLVAATVALGAAGPAAAQPIGSDAPVGVAPPPVQHYGKANVLPPFTGVKVPHYGKANVLAPNFVPRQASPEPTAPATPRATASARPAVHHAAESDGSELVYVLLGGVVFAIGGLGGTLVANRRHATQTGGRVRPRIAA